MKNDNKIDLNYHIKQYKKTYETSKQIIKFLDKKFPLNNKSILDFGCGAGSNLYFLMKKYKIMKGAGVENDKRLVKIAKQEMKKRGIKDIKFYFNDIENPKKMKKNIQHKIDVVTILQVLSVMDHYKKTINSAIYFKPKFIAVCSLFWDGYLDIKVKVNFLKKNKEGLTKTALYNIYSIQKYLEFMKSKGYKKNFIKKLDISKMNFIFKNKKIMGTFSSTLNGKKVLVTGPLLQSWYFILSRR